MKHCINVAKKREGKKKERKDKEAAGQREREREREREARTLMPCIQALYAFLLGATKSTASSSYKEMTQRKRRNVQWCFFFGNICEKSIKKAFRQNIGRARKFHP